MRSARPAQLSTLIIYVKHYKSRGSSLYTFIDPPVTCSTKLNTRPTSDFSEVTANIFYFYISSIQNRNTFTVTSLTNQSLRLDPRLQVEGNTSNIQPSVLRQLAVQLQSSMWRRVLLTATSVCLSYAALNLRKSQHHTLGYPANLRVEIPLGLNCNCGPR